MPSRSSSTSRLRRGPFRAHSQPPVEGAPPPPEFPDVKVTRITGRSRGRRGVEAEFDHTTYSCQCGFVFQAAVLTSVACPHCGDAQAW